eukprot:TRINITY_DN3427_c1_g1_i1.p1 TRINITY_DN3427_c1_g1~~TRINITY_DN3427_c1_g1_i1.p1  ORF type:complete len:308 (+),score=137.05 TRINITY_DN3427_c1_g1_i1:102-926(+)
MGYPMARNLAVAGVSLLVWNRSADKSAALRDEFPDLVKVAQTPTEVVQGTKVVYSMLSNLEAHAAVFPLVLEGVSQGKAIVDCATLTPEAMAASSKQITEKGGVFLEAPVSGSKKPAEDGTLIFLTAGDEALKTACEPHFAKMGKSVKYYGPEVGQGSRMKLVVNVTMGTMMAAAGEGVGLAEKSGFAAGDLMEVISEGAMACPLYSLKTKNIVSKEYPPAFPLKHAHKDMKFALDLAKTLDAPLPVAAAAEAQFAQSTAVDADFSAVVEVFRK